VVQEGLIVFASLWHGQPDQSVCQSATRTFVIVAKGSGAVVKLTVPAKAGIEGDVRPAHDLRHSSITNAAAAGTKPEALMSRAGHASYSTTRRYIDLAGEQFREEAERLEERLWGQSSTNRRTKTPERPRTMDTDRDR
jgi:integrase